MSPSRVIRTALSVAALSSTCLLGAEAAAGSPTCGGQHSVPSDCGESDIYPCCANGGNCTWWAWDAACSNWHVALPGWGNANTWGQRARQNPSFEVVGTPIPNSIATRDLGAFGHVAWVTAVSGSTITVTEENCCTNCAPGMRSINYNQSYFDSGFVIRVGQECTCQPGDTQTEPCACGTRSRGCGSCDWAAWGECVAPDYAASLVDTSYPQALNAGEQATIWAEFRNTGGKPWPKDGLWMGALGAPDGGASALFSPADAWPAWDVTAVLDSPVAPGDVGRFTFVVTAPATPGADVAETFQLQMPGETFVACPSAEITPSIQILPAAIGAGGSGGAGGAAPASAESGGGCSQSSSRAGWAWGPATALAFLIFAGSRRPRPSAARSRRR